MNCKGIPPRGPTSPPPSRKPRRFPELSGASCTRAPIGTRSPARPARRTPQGTAVQRTPRSWSSRRLRTTQQSGPLRKQALPCAASCQNPVQYRTMASAASSSVKQSAPAPCSRCTELAASLETIHLPSAASLSTRALCHSRILDFLIQLHHMALQRSDVTIHFPQIQHRSEATQQLTPQAPKFHLQIRRPRPLHTPSESRLYWYNRASQCLSFRAATPPFACRTPDCANGTKTCRAHLPQPQPSTDHAKPGDQPDPEQGTHPPPPKPGDGRYHSHAMHRLRKRLPVVGDEEVYTPLTAPSRGKARRNPHSSHHPWPMAARASDRPP